MFVVGGIYFLWWKQHTLLTAEISFPLYLLLGPSSDTPSRDILIKLNKCPLASDQLRPSLIGEGQSFHVPNKLIFSFGLEKKDDGRLPSLSLSGEDAADASKRENKNFQYFQADRRDHGGEWPAQFEPWLDVAYRRRTERTRGSTRRSRSSFGETRRTLTESWSCCCWVSITSWVLLARFQWPFTHRVRDTTTDCRNKTP